MENVKMTVENHLGTKISWEKVEAHEQELLHKIKSAHLDGKSKNAGYWQKSYLTSYDARLIATRKAFTAIKPKHRPPISKLPAIASSLNARCGTQEKVGVLWKAKKSNIHQFRPVMAFGIENRALQYLTGAAIAARADLHPMQFAVNGGRDAAVQRACEALASGFIYVAEMDIQNCYSSFNGKKIQALLPIPKEVTEKVVLSQFLNLYPLDQWSQSWDDPDVIEIMCGDDLAEARQGIAQGSAVSSIVAEIVLAPVLANIPKKGVALAYADNILLMAKNAEDAVSMNIALRDLLIAHPAGPLKLKKPKVYKPGQSVDFLGYRLRSQGGKYDIEPTSENLKKFKTRFSRDLKQLQSKGQDVKFKKKTTLRLKQYVMSWSGAFALWSGAVKHRKIHMENLECVLSSLEKNAS